MSISTKQSFRDMSASVGLKRQCQDALVCAVDYLVKNLCPLRGWSDFPTNQSGESTSWVTAHVLGQTGVILPHRVLQTSLQALLSQQQDPGTWGFSHSTPPDCDSTLHVLNAIFRLGVKKINIAEPIRFVLLHQSKQGRFRTYRDKILLAGYRGTSNDLNYNGWMQPHVCVTAVALETLMHFPDFVPNHVLTNIADFLLETQTPEGYWESYWWRSKYFATTRIIQQFDSINNARLKEGILKALDWLIQSANIDGYWDNGYDTGKACPLSTANCIKALLATEAQPKELIMKGVSWLLQQQNNDGSWKGIPALQIPPPHVKNPSDIAVWKVGARGVGSCCLDEKRIYTTATVASAFHRFILERSITG